MKKIILMLTTVMVFALVALAVFAASSDKARVGFSLERYFSLEVKNGDSVEFGSLDPNGGPYTKKNGSALRVESNTDWSLSTSKAVIEAPEGADANAVLNALTVSLETSEGNGDDNDIKVDYTLDDLENLPAGDYVIEVTFTGSTK